MSIATVVMPHSVALLTALSGLGATAAHTKAEAGLEACFLHTSFADAGQAAANVAAAPHVCTAPVFLKVVGKTASDFFSGLLSGVKVVTAGRPPDVCLSAGATQGFSPTYPLWTGGVAKAISTNITALKANGAKHASAQLLTVKHHAAIDGGSGGGHGPACGSLAALHANSARDISDAGTAASFGHTFPMDSTAHAATATAAQATAGATAPAAGVATGMSGVAAKTTLGCKGVSLSAQSKGMLVSKTAAHGGHNAWKTRSSFFGRRKGATQGAGKARGSDRAAARTQKQTEKEIRQRQRQLERDQRKQQQQAQREQRRQQREVQRQQRAQQRSQQRAYRQQRAESRRLYRQERDRLKQEQRQMRSLARNEMRMQRERERLAAARAQGRGGFPYSSSGYGQEGSSGGRLHYTYGGREGARYGGGGAYGGGGGLSYGRGSYYDGRDVAAGGLGVSGEHGDYGDTGYNGGDGDYADTGYYDGGTETADSYQDMHQGDYSVSPIGTTQRVYTHPGGAEGIKSVTVIQDVAETKGGVTLHHVTETTSRNRNVVAPQEEGFYASCCFMQLRSFTSTTILRRVFADGVPEKKNETVASQGGEGLGDKLAAAATDVTVEMRGTAARASPATYAVVNEECCVATAPLSKSGSLIARGRGRRLVDATDTIAAGTKRDWIGKGRMILHSIKEEDEGGIGHGTEEVEVQTLRENIFLQTKGDAASACFLNPSSGAHRQPSQRHSPLYYSEDSQLQQQQLQRQGGRQQQRPPQYRRKGSKRHALCERSACSSRRLVIWIEGQQVDAEVTCFETEAESRVIQESSVFNKSFGRHQEKRGLMLRRESRECCWGLSIGGSVNDKEVYVAQNCDHEEPKPSTTVGKNICTSGPAAATGSSATISVAAERASKSLIGRHSKEGTGNLGSTAKIVNSIAQRESTSAAKEFNLVVRDRDAEVASKFQSGEELRSRATGRRADNSVAHSGSIERSSMAGEGHSVEEQNKVREGSAVEAESNTGTFCRVDLLRPDEREHAAAIHFGVRAASTAATFYPENTKDVQATFRSVAAATGQVFLPVVDATFCRSATPRKCRGLPLISGRRVQLSFLPFRKLMYTNFF